MADDRTTSDRTEREPLSIDDAATHLLEECRMVLPGVQALFGFQLIAVFNQGFASQLAPGERRLHLLAVALVTLAIALVMAPAALHRQAEPRAVSERFVALSSRLLLLSMLPLTVGLCLDVYLVARIVLGRGAPAAAVAGGLFAAFVLLWLVLPNSRALQRAAAGR